MFGGNDSSNLVFPVFMEENRFQYDPIALPQLQLFGDFPIGCSVDPLNYMGNEHATATNRPVKRDWESEPVSKKQKLQPLNNNFCQDEAGDAGRILNQNPVSTVRRLSNGEDGRNSSITSTSEGMRVPLPGISSLTDSLKLEIDLQKEEFDHYIRLQEASTMKGIRELKQRQLACFLNALEKGVSRKLQEKEVEIENMNSKNKELGEKIKQVAMEAQSWHHRAKYDESVVNALKSNLQQQLIAQGAIQVREGCGESQVDDTASYANQNHHHHHHHHQGTLGSSLHYSVSAKQMMNCRACEKGKEVSVLLMPCRHLCLCEDCEGFVDICPVCQATKTASVQVIMS